MFDEGTTQARNYEEALRASAEEREDLSRLAFAAGFAICAAMNGMKEEEAKRQLQHAWKKWCGVDS